MSEEPRFVVKWSRTANGLYMRLERPLVGGKRQLVAWWTREVEDATSFLSIEDAWLSFDRSECGRREDYDVLSLAEVSP